MWTTAGSTIRLCCSVVVIARLTRCDNLPLLLTRGRNLGLVHDRHQSFADQLVKYADLHLAPLRALGIEQDSFAKSTGTLPELFTV